MIASILPGENYQKSSGLSCTLRINVGAFSMFSEKLNA
jgi:hypothetical protein